jgi:hypothetical protein
MLAPLLLAAALAAEATPAEPKPAPAAPAITPAPGPAPAPGRQSIAVLDFTSSAPIADLARGLATVVAARLESAGARVVTKQDMTAVLGFEKQKTLLSGCDSASCMAELAGALGVKFVVFGQLEKIGTSWLVALSYYDGKGFHRLAETVKAEDLLIVTAEGEADKVAAAAGLRAPEPAPVPAAKPEPPAAVTTEKGETAGHIALKVGGTPELGRFNLEYDYYVNPAFQLLLQGTVLLSRQGFSAIPAGFGAKYTLRADKEVRPYLGVVAGFSLIDREGVHLNFTMLGGVAYVPFKHFGVLLEGSADTASIKNPQGGQPLLSGALSLGLMGIW